MKMFSKLILATAGALALMTAPVQAASFNWLSFAEPAEIPMLAADSLVNAAEGETWDLSGQYSTPWDDEDDGREYTYVQAGGSATYSGFGTATAVSLLWGSVDTYNSIEFWFNGVKNEVLTGTQALVGYVPAVGKGAGTIQILADAAFDTMIFKSSSNAFEYANLQVTAVPLPAALPLYGAGIAVLGFMGWRRRQKTAA
ncbi:MAG: VPLPA-CTERM sorting domain-containing protein [Sneathiella sp.]